MPQRKKHYRLTPRALAARRANLRKAWAAPKEVIYRRTEKRQAASRANLAKAIAARRSPGGGRAARMNALKHGLFARDVQSSVRRLGESPEEFRAHLGRFERSFSPQDEVEKELVERLAFAVWRRLRLFRAQAGVESDRVKKLLDAPPEGGISPAKATAVCGYTLGKIFYDLKYFFEQLAKLQSQVESLLRALVRKRSGGAMDFHVYAPRRESEFTKTSGIAGRTRAPETSLRAMDLDSLRKGSSVSKKTDLVDELLATELSRRLEIASGDHD